MFTKIFDYRILRYVTLVLYGILCLLIYRMLAYLNSYDLTANDDNSTAARHPPLRHAVTVTTVWRLPLFPRPL